MIRYINVNENSMTETIYFSVFKILTNCCWNNSIFRNFREFEFYNWALNCHGLDILWIHKRANMDWDLASEDTLWQFFHRQILRKFGLLWAPQWWSGQHATWCPRALWCTAAQIGTTRTFQPLMMTILPESEAEWWFSHNYYWKWEAKSSVLPAESKIHPAS